MTGMDEGDVSISKEKQRRVRERVLQAEKEKLHLKYPQGIINDVEQIIREEIE